MSLLKNIQNSVAQVLNEHPFFSTEPAIQVFPENLGDITSQIEIAVGQIGICCVVSTPGAKRPNGKLFWDEISIAVTVYENPTLNTDRPRASLVSEAATYILQYHNPTLSDTGDPVPVTGNVINAVSIEPEMDTRLGLVLSVALFTTKGGMKAVPTR